MPVHEVSAASGADPTPLSHSLASTFFAPYPDLTAPKFRVSIAYLASGNGGVESAQNAPSQQTQNL